MVLNFFVVCDITAHFELGDRVNLDGTAICDSKSKTDYGRKQHWKLHKCAWFDTSFSLYWLSINIEQTCTLVFIKFWRGHSHLYLQWLSKIHKSMVCVSVVYVWAVRCPTNITVLLCSAFLCLWSLLCYLVNVLKGVFICCISLKMRGYLESITILFAPFSHIYAFVVVNMVRRISVIRFLYQHTNCDKHIGHYRENCPKINWTAHPPFVCIHIHDLKIITSGSVSHIIGICHNLNHNICSDEGCTLHLITDIRIWIQNNSSIHEVGTRCQIACCWSETWNSSTLHWERFWYFYTKLKRRSAFLSGLYWAHFGMNMYT